MEIYLPLIEDEATALVEKIKYISRGNERILFIEDEPDIVCVGKRILEGLGYKVVTLTSSIETLEIFKKDPNQFYLVITDMTMPFMTGDELSEEFIRIKPDIPIIICTGYSEIITKDNVSSFGIKGYLGKPLLKSEIADTIRRILDKNDKEE